MLNPTGIKAPAVLAVLCAFTALSASAAEPGVHDDARMFSAGTIERVNDIARQIARDYHYDLVVETFPTIPEDLKDRMAQSSQSTFYDTWLTSNARKEGVHGVYILVVKDPGHLQIGAGKETRQKAFTDTNRDTLRDAMLGAFRQKDFDTGLVNGAVLVQQSIAANLGLPAPPVANESAGPSTRPTSSPAETSTVTTESGVKAVPASIGPTTRPATSPSGQ